MKRELKQAWIDALRSGDYQQGPYYLHRGKTYCCIGVLCEVGKFDGWDGTTYCRNSHFIHPEHWKMLSGTEQETQGDLQTMNDIGRASFTEIADWIEENIDAS